MCFTLNKILWFVTSNLFTAIISCRVTLWLTDRKNNREAEIRFRNRLSSLAYELRFNFKDVGNSQNPFQTKALENLVYNEPLIHKHPDLFYKAQHCLNTALILSTSSMHPQLKPGQGQHLMKDLSEYLTNFYAIKIDPI